MGDFLLPPPATTARQAVNPILQGKSLTVETWGFTGGIFNLSNAPKVRKAGAGCLHPFHRIKRKGLSECGKGDGMTPVVGYRLK